MKQINVAYQEFKEELVRLINTSGLPMFLVAECLTLVQSKVQEVANQQLEQAKKQEREENLQDLQTNADEDVV